MDVTEIDVARILLELPQVIYESEVFNRRFSFTWGAKRRRSSSSSSPSSSKIDTPTSLPLVRFQSLPSPPSAPSAPVGPSPACEPEKSKALSPSTPLLFSPSESDDKSKHNKRKVSLKRVLQKREECLQTLEKLTENKQFFQEEIKNVRRHYDQLKDLNLKLKARKQMITSVGLQKETHQIQVSSSNVAMELVPLPQPTTPIQFHVQQHLSLYTLNQPPLIMNQTAFNNGQSLVSFTVNDNVGPLGIPDLNVSLDDSFELESEQHPQQQQQQLQKQNPSIETKALAAQARQRRIQICRSKNPNVAASKLRFPVYR